MCILCVVQRWSRRIATMLPWLVLPLIVLWAVSQLLPPALRFEVTSPRLACVLVLLATLCWYEVLMPRLSLWRARRSDRLRERRRAQAIELHKLRRAATRRCRNCHTPYRNQNPGGGRFMCCYCGHISKRPVLDLPVSPENSTLIGDLRNGWICGGQGQDWPVDGIPQYWINGSNSGHLCMAEKSYSGTALFASRLLSCFLVSLRWLCRTIFHRFGSSPSDGSSDGDQRGSSGKRDAGEGFQESRGEKAKRKAEEKRQAKLEKELLEEEERKQREEVARLVEERRKLRDEKLEAERMQLRNSAREREREIRKEAQKARQERQRDLDKGSSKSNSDVEEFDRRGSRESERKREFDKKGESQRRALENYKAHAVEQGNSVKETLSRPRYFDRVKGSILSSSRGFTTGSFWGRNPPMPSASATKVNKPGTGSGDWTGSGNKCNAVSVGPSNFNKTVGSKVKPEQPAPKKAWHLLFARSSDDSACKDSSGNLNQNVGGDSQCSYVTRQGDASPFYADKHINTGHPLPFSNSYFVNDSFDGNLVSTDRIHRELANCSVPEEAELFEDPCFIPDPASLLGPIRESLDSLPLDLGAGFIVNNDLQESLGMKNAVFTSNTSKSSPVESPLSRLSGPEGRYTAFDQCPCTPKSKNMYSTTLEDASNGAEHGTWQMWGSPSAQDGLAGPSSWFSTIDHKNYHNEGIMHPLCQKSLSSQVAYENHINGNCSPQNSFFSNVQNGGLLAPLDLIRNNVDPWIQKTHFQPLPVNEGRHFPPFSVAHNELRHGSPGIPVASTPLELPHRDRHDGHGITVASTPLELPQRDSWSKRDSAHCDAMDPRGLTPPGANVGRLFPGRSNVGPVWSFNQMEKI